MQLSKHHIILIFVGLVTLLLGALLFINPPALFPDPANGFLVMRSMQLGAGFNLLVSPDQNDISKNTAVFLSWWSPGQYLVPYFFKSVFNVNTGQASALTVCIFELSGLAGFYLFFKRIGFSPLISAISLAFIACQVAFTIPFVFYNGGEILVFGFEGWFFYGCIALKKTNVKLLAFILLAGWFGFFCKSSFMWIYAAGMICLWIRLSGRTMISYIKTGIWIAVPALTSLAAIYFFYLSKGINPASAASGLKFTWEAFSFPLASPLLAGFSIDDLFQGLVNEPVHAPCFIIAVLLLLAALSLLLLAAIVYYVPNKNYALFMTIVYVVSVIFFTGGYLRQANISYEARHYRIIGLLIVPGIIYLISTLPSVYRWLFSFLCLLIAFAGYTYLLRGYTYNKNVSARGNSGIAQEFIDQASLNYLQQLDAQNKNALFVFISPDLGQEILHNRIITIDAPNRGDKIDYGDYTYDGHAGPLYLLLPASYPQAAVLLKFFPGYGPFLIKTLSSKYVLYSAK